MKLRKKKAVAWIIFVTIFIFTSFLIINILFVSKHFFSKLNWEIYYFGGPNKLDIINSQYIRRNFLEIENPLSSGRICISAISE